MTQNVIESLRKLIETLKAFYFISFDRKEFFAELEDAVNNAPKTISQSAIAFQHNLNSVVEVISLPLTFASESVKYAHFDRILIAERINKIPVDEIIARELGEPIDQSEIKAKEELREKEALEAAIGRMKEISSSDDEKIKLATDALQLLGQLHSYKLTLSAAELLRQGVVLTWGTFEVLVRDVFVVLLNEKPSRVMDLMQNDKTRRRFELKSIPLERLAERDFNLSTAMGDVIAENRDLTDLTVIKDVVRVLFSNSNTLHDLLNATELWRLNQQRHLIVHRRGIVDQSYLDKTGDTFALGSELIIYPDILKCYLELVRDIGRQLILEIGNL